MPNPRAATAEDAAGIRAIVNHYITETTANFKTVPLADAEFDEWLGKFSESGRFRIRVADDDDGGLAGFACCQRFHERCAYETSVMSTVYLAPAARGKGVGSALYEALFASIAGEDIHRVFAGITLPNPASVALHRKFNFHDVGKFSEAGRKFGRYWDVLWMEKSDVG